MDVSHIEIRNFTQKKYLGVNIESIEKGKNHVIKPHVYNFICK